MKEVKKYRAKPVIKEAVKLTYDNAIQVADWCGGVMSISEVSGVFSYKSIEVKTMEGTMTADLGDYVIKGLRGEFYPCKPDIFEKTYEEVE